MKKYILLLLLQLLIFQFLSAQKQYSKWYFGHFAGLDFSSGSPVPVTNGGLNTLEGCASICDSNGNLLFYTDGDSIWNRKNNLMLNGSGLYGNFSSTQSALIVPSPENPGIYYVFTADAQAGNMPPSYTGYGGIAYSMVDMSLDSGYGAVTKLNQPLVTPACEKLSATHSSNEIDYWVVVHQWATDAFYAYLVTDTGIQSPVISNPGGVIPQDPFLQYNNGEAIGYLKFSHDGTKLVCAHYTGLNTVEIFDFDNSTGIVSNPIADTTYLNISGEDGPYGVSFSPDDSKLYVSYLQYDSVYEAGFFDIWETFGSSNQIYQYNMKAGSSAAIIASRTTVASRKEIAFGALQCGPDGKIYVANEYENSTTDGANNYLDVINNPDSLGAACNYQQDEIFLNTGGVNQSLFGLPNCIDSSSSSITTKAISIFNNNNLEVYPNPAANNLYVSGYSSSAKQLSITDVTGRSIMAQPIHSSDSQTIVNISNISAGIYFLSIRNENGSMGVKKFVKE